jgi:hypothetical protein
MRPSTASAQSSSDSRWTLLPGGYAKVPVKDLRYAAAYRLISDSQRKLLAVEIAARRSEAEALRAVIKAMEEEAKLKDERVKAIVTRNGELEDGLVKCATKRDKLKPWARIGQVSVGVLALIAGYTIYSVTVAP